MTKLKPCPFCGSTNIIVSSCKEWEENYVGECEEYVAVICNSEEGGCGANSGYCRTEEEAIEVWNRRVKKR